MMRFPLGQTVITKRALEVLETHDIMTALSKHINCNWGDLCEEDKKMNDIAVVNGERILSSYLSENNVKFWIITEADRSATTVLLPEDY